MSKYLFIGILFALASLLTMSCASVIYYGNPGYYRGYNSYDLSLGYGSGGSYFYAGYYNAPNYYSGYYNYPGYYAAPHYGWNCNTHCYWLGGHRQCYC